MGVEVTFQGKGLSTHLKLVRFFSCVHMLMSIEVTFLGKGLSTHLTLVRFFSCVQMLMSIEVTFLGKGLSTHLTLVRFFSVHMLMSIEVTFLGKSISTDLTLVRFFSCVHTLMSIEDRFLRKSFSTDLTLVRLFSRVHTLMPNERRFVRKSPSTHLTLVRLFLLDCAHAGHRLEFFHTKKKSSKFSSSEIATITFATRIDFRPKIDEPIISVYTERGDQMPGFMGESRSHPAHVYFSPLSVDSRPIGRPTRSQPTVDRLSADCRSVGFANNLSVPSQE